MHENISSAGVLVSRTGEVKISDIERCKRGGDLAKLTDAFSKVVMNLMDKTKSCQIGTVGLSRADLWSKEAFETFVLTSSQPSLTQLLHHAFMKKRSQTELAALVCYSLLKAHHDCQIPEMDRSAHGVVKE